MTGIAGIAAPGRDADLQRMLSAMASRGRGPHRVWEAEGVTLGVVPETTEEPWPHGPTKVRDETGPERYVRVRVRGGQFHYERDTSGVAPLYLGKTPDGYACFASTIRALRQAGVRTPVEYWSDNPPPPLPSLDDPPETLAGELRRRLEEAVSAGISSGRAMGVWLSGGLDSTAVTALAARGTDRPLPTFVAGLAGSGDLRFAREAASILKTDHHEVIVMPERLRQVLPEVIEALESFDPLLVRSSLMHYLAAQEASRWVEGAFSGEGSDELFAGYAWLKRLSIEALDRELLLLPWKLHHTALQRVDRCAGAFGITPCLPFLHPAVAEWAYRIPIRWKLRMGCEKWILREAVRDRLPRTLVERPKAKFWQGSGVGECLREWADQAVSDHDYEHGRRLENGWILNSKEEYLYYRLFRERLGDFESLDWMGRTPVTPEDAVPPSPIPA